MEKNKELAAALHAATLGNMAQSISDPTYPSWYRTRHRKPPRAIRSWQVRWAQAPINSPAPDIA